MRVAASWSLKIGLLAILLLGWSLDVPEAAAHAELVRAQPASGEAVASAPAEIRLSFTETVDPGLSRISLLASDGTRVPLGAVVTDPADAHMLLVDVPDAASLAPGVYTVVWSAYSAEDDHTSRGSYTFSAGTGVASGDDARSTQSVSTVAVLGKWLELAGVVLITGLAVFAASAGKPVSVLGAGRVNAFGILAAIGLAGALLSFPARELAITGRPFVSGIDTRATSNLLSSTYGHAWLIRSIALIAALGLALMGRRRVAIVAIAVLGAVALASMAASGHAGSVDRPLVARTVDFLHMSGAAIWLGGLLGLLLVVEPERGSDAFRDLLRAQGNRFAGAILIIGAAGVASAWWHVGGRRGLTDSSYGRLLIVKVVVVIVLLGVAFYNRRVLQGPRPKLEWVPFAIGLELLLALVVLLLSADLSLIPPANRPLTVDVAARAIKLDTGATAGLSTVHLTGILSGDPTDTIEIAVSPETDLQRVILRSELYDSTADASVGDRFDAAPVDLEAGSFQFPAGRLGIAGDWQLEITVRRAGVPDDVVSLRVDTSSLAAQGVSKADDEWAGLRPTSHTLLAVTLTIVVLLVGLGGMRRLAGYEPLASAFLLAASMVIAGGFLVSAARSLVPVTTAHDVENPVSFGSATLTDAGDLYRLNCAACHGADGSGPGGGNSTHLHGNGADLTRTQAVQQSDGDLWYWIGHGVPGSEMPAFANALFEDERWALVAYLRWLQADAEERAAAEE